jgi:hypothetical protein
MTSNKKSNSRSKRNRSTVRRKIGSKVGGMRRRRAPSTRRRNRTASPIKRPVKSLVSVARRTGEDLANRAARALNTLARKI